MWQWIQPNITKSFPASRHNILLVELEDTSSQNTVHGGAPIRPTSI